MRVLITGGHGQLGRDLAKALVGHELLVTDAAELDITHHRAVGNAISTLKPDAVINCAALTDTSRCEREPEAAHAANAAGAANVAEACREAGAWMLHVSTNEVFDGEKGSPYAEDDPANPVNAYGRSKLAGERLVREVLPDRHWIVRTSWLYGEGVANFPAKIVAAARSRGSLSVVTDEIATPTWTRDLSEAIARLIERRAPGTYHLTNSGECSRFDWAAEILRLAGVEGVALEKSDLASFYASNPQSPRKPAYSVLANERAAALGIVLPPWRDALRERFALAGEP